MNMTPRFAVAASLLAVGLAGATAAAADGVAVKVANDGTQDVLVTIYDNGTSPSRTVLQQERINGFTVVPIQVLADATGRANLSWTAVAVDHGDRKCGQARNVEVADSDQLTVSANQSCGE